MKQIYTSLILITVTLFTLTGCDIDDDRMEARTLEGTWTGYIDNYYYDRWGETGNSYRTAFYFERENAYGGWGYELDYDARSPHQDYWYCDFRWNSCMATSASSTMTATILTSSSTTTCSTTTTSAAPWTMATATRALTSRSTTTAPSTGAIGHVVSLVESMTSIMLQAQVALPENSNNLSKQKKRVSALFFFVYSFNIVNSLNIFIASPHSDFYIITFLNFYIKK